MVNMPVIARMNSKSYNIANNDMFTVSELTDSCCVLSGGKKPNTEKGKHDKGRCQGRYQRRRDQNRHERFSKIVLCSICNHLPQITRGYFQPSVYNSRV